MKKGSEDDKKLYELIVKIVECIDKIDKKIIKVK